MVRSIILLFASSLLFSLKSYAAPRSEQEAREMAKNFFYSKNTRSAYFNGDLELVATSNSLGDLQTRNISTQSPAWYLYTANDKGFVLISGDDRMKDILGYSQNTVVSDSIPENMKVWLSYYTAQAQNLNQTSDKTPYVILTKQEYPESVAPLLGEICFDQGEPYNQLCPVVLDQVCPTGCSATAMASILKYWEYPQRGTGSISYTTTIFEIDRTFNFEKKDFDYDNILPTYTEGNYNEKQQEAVAYLMAACGAACKMEYTPIGSGANINDILTGMIKYLNYNPYSIIENREAYTAQEWMNLIKEELSNKRPILYNGVDNAFNGHSFIVDGYDKDNMVHVNWGWNGYYNGYFEILTLDPSGTGIGGGNGSGYAYNQNMISGLAPKTVLSDARSSFKVNQFTINNQTAKVSSLYNLGYNFTGEIAVIAEENGVQTKLCTPVTAIGLSPTYGYTDLSFNLDKLKSLKSGIYEVYVGSKSLFEDSWTRCKGEGYHKTTYLLYVTENGSYMWGTNSESEICPEITLTTNTGIYASSFASVSLDIYNPREQSEFFGEMRIIFINKETNQIDYYERCGQVFLESKADTSYSYTLSIPEDMTGKYTIYPCWYSNNMHYICGEGIETEIQNAQKTTEVTVFDGVLNKNTFYPGETISYKGKATLETEEGNIFSGYLTGTICTADFTVLSYKEIPVIVEEQKESPFQIDMPADQSPGDYLFVVANFEGEKGKILDIAPITIKTPSGIKDVNTSNVEPIFIGIQEGIGIQFKINKKIRTATLYNMSGQIVAQGTPILAGQIYTFEVGQLDNDVYMLRLQAEDGHNYTIKIKK